MKFEACRLERVPHTTHRVAQTDAQRRRYLNRSGTARRKPRRLGHTLCKLQVIGHPGVFSSCGVTSGIAIKNSDRQRTGECSCSFVFGIWLDARLDQTLPDEQACIRRRVSVQRLCYSIQCTAQSNFCLEQPCEQKDLLYTFRLGPEKRAVASAAMPLEPDLLHAAESLLTSWWTGHEVWR